MTYKEKKEYLESYINAKHRIFSLQNDLEQWRTIGTSITQKITPVIVNTNEVNSKVENCAIKISEIERMILDELESLEYNKAKVIVAIESVRDMRRREILEMRYIGDVPVKKIAIHYDKDVDNIYKMLRTGIKVIQIEGSDEQ